MRVQKLLPALSVFNLLANLWFPVLAIRALGASHAADALFLVFILPAVIAVLLGNSVLNWSTPRLVRRVDAAARRQLSWSLLWVLLACVGALCVLLCLLLWLLVQFALPPLDPAGSHALAMTILPAGVVAILASVVAAVAQALFTAERNVVGSEGRTLLANLLAMLAWLLLDPVTLAGCAALFALRAVLVALLLAPWLGRPLRLEAGDRDLRAVLRESRWLLLAATYYKSEPFVDRLLFASVSAGAVAAFHLAHQILALMTVLMNRVITATLVAPLAEAVHASAAGRARRLLQRALLGMAVTGVLVWVGFVLAGEPLVRLLFAGVPTAVGQIELTAQLLVLLGGYMLGILLGQVLGQALYTTGDTRAMMALGSAGFTLGLVIKVLALWQFGVIGLAAALSVSWLLNALLFYGFRPAIFRRPANSEREQHRQ